MYDILTQLFNQLIFNLLINNFISYSKSWCKRTIGANHRSKWRKCQVCTINYYIQFNKFNLTITTSLFSHAKHLIGDTIRRNASPVRLEGNQVSVRDSTSSLNSSASEESGRPLPQQHVSRALLHSFSTNDVPLGEFRYTVNVGSGHCIKLIGNNLTILNVIILFFFFFVTSSWCMIL